VSASEERAPSPTTAPPALPRALLPLLGFSLALAAWLWRPEGLALRSDDWLALKHASTPAGVLGDFFGPQYGMTRIALFHRPLITLSFAFDLAFGGTGDFLPLLQNLCVHLASGLLLFAIARRFVPPPAAWAVMTAWLLHPGHREALFWAVGRVDTHSTFFYLLALLLLLRRAERRETGSPAGLVLPLSAFAAGCLTKEPCLTLPAAVPALLWMRGERSLRILARETAPWLFTLGFLLTWRYLALGEVLGGYAEARPDPRFLEGLVAFFVPGGLGTGSLVLAGLLGISFLLFLRLRLGGSRDPARPLLGAVFLALLTALPGAGASGGPDAPAKARYRYLPSAVMTLGLGLAGPLPPLLLLSGALPATLEARRDAERIATEVQRLRTRIEEQLGSARGLEPVFVEAPAGDEDKPLFHVGVDRLGLPPFHRPPRILLPDRRLFPIAAPFPPPRGLRRLPLRYEGPRPLDDRGLRAVTLGSPARLSFPGVHAVSWRVSWATVFGRFETRVPAEPDGTLSLKALFLAPPEGRKSPSTIEALWPAVETAVRPEPFLRALALDGKGRPLCTNLRLFPLPLTRELGPFLRPKRPGLWILALVLLAAAAAQRLGGSGGGSSSRSPPAPRA